VRVVVVGAGAIGTLLAGSLLEAGHSVTVVTRPAYLARLRTEGLRVESASGVRTYRVPIEDRPPADGTDLAVLAVKTFDVAGAASALGRAPPVPTLLPQNGLGIERIVAGALRDSGWADPTRYLVRAVNSVPSTALGPGVVRWGGQGEILLPDAGEAGDAAPYVAAFRDLLAGAGLRVRTVPGFARELWRKAVLNAAINPVTAVRGIPNGELRNEPYRSEAITLLHEAAQAAARAGVFFADAEIEEDWERVVRSTATNRSSMLQDLDRGRPTEIDAISGELLRTAAAHGLELPATRAIIDRVMERVGRTAGRAQPS
jgi:2-dehydropantoate 2-reductase